MVLKKGRHHRGVAGGKWKHRAPKTLKIVLPNLHSFKGLLNGKKGKWRLCTKCLRIVKEQQKTKSAKKKTPASKSA